MSKFKEQIACDIDNAFANTDEFFEMHTVNGKSMPIMLDENENMGFYLPESGTNLWSDAMVIPKNAKNPELAHAFINYIVMIAFTLAII